MGFAVRYCCLKMLCLSRGTYIPSAVLQLPLTIWCRFCKAARRVLHTTEVNDFVVLHLALQHCYPLRRLITTELTPRCDLGSYLCAGDWIRLMGLPSTWG